MKSRLTKKQKVGDAANRWFARNRSLVLRQTPVWAQSLAVIVISLGSISVAAGIFFRIDEVVSVQGQLKSIGGTIEVKSPVGGKIEDIFYKDGDIVEVNQLLIRFDTTEAAQKSKVLKKLIDLEQKQLNTQIESINSQILTVDGRIKVLKQRLKTKTNAVSEMQRLVSLGGFQMLQFLDQKDQLFEISSQINELNEQKERLKLQASQISLSSQKSIDQMESELKVAELKLRYQSVKAPSSGIIFDPKASIQEFFHQANESYPLFLKRAFMPKYMFLILILDLSKLVKRQK